MQRATRARLAALTASVVLATTGCSSPEGASATAVVPEKAYEASVGTSPPRSTVPPPPVLPKRPAGKSLEGVVEEIVLKWSADMGAILGSPEWKSLRTQICGGLAAGDSSFYLSNAAAALPNEEQWQFVDLYLESATEGTCPGYKKPKAPVGLYYQSDMHFAVTAGLMIALDESEDEYHDLLMQYIDDVSAYGRRYHVDVSYLLATLPLSSGSSHGSGYNVTCADGWVSSSSGKQGACSHHGGIR